MSRKRNSLEIINTTKGRLPRLPFEDMKRKILGARYDLSCVIIGDMRSRTLNKKYRKKDYIANVLSFPLSNHEGELFINLREAKRDARNFNMTYKKFVGYLFIHGLLHLKGYTHGSTMDTIERTWKKRFRL